ncbi:Nitrilase/cyanide hydratase and apolipoprotein N-acyltransferase [Bacillus methanolicus PB1]|uniref:Nitrilase/cyanide hydratase and apolipoprotein N-acyltransferase n=1 Tax=Bacillus methanolicus PB1 TaxID=997296 RepID=I3DVK7_BACMT|nr:carbon-nitrogen hydrolase family protein [Bacillus methanolicus]EIJ78278.1 Nitrilase/cyanide hydratase and apolipoprotein N-acyltransferase [Bacillus methanolicus PB1]
MENLKNQVRVAVVQAAPVIMDLYKTIEKVRLLTADAAKKGAKLVLFPEAYIPAYPRGMTFGTVVGSRSKKGREDWYRYWENSIFVPSKETEILGSIAKDNSVYLVIGVIEKEQLSGTLYCTVLYFSPDGNLLGKHRKLKPTASERIIWGEGDGSTLPVFDTSIGKMGGLICWENYMPLARMAMYSKGVEIYLMPTADEREVWQSTIRHIALEGRCFVLSCNQFVTKDMYPTDLACYDELESEPEIMCNGGSAIIGPLGEYIVGPVYGKEDILIADLDLKDIVKSRFDFDVNGHYSRPDVFQLTINEAGKTNVTWE